MLERTLIIAHYLKIYINENMLLQMLIGPHIKVHLGLQDILHSDVSLSNFQNLISAPRRMH